MRQNSVVEESIIMVVLLYLLSALMCRCALFLRVGRELMKFYELTIRSFWLYISPFFFKTVPQDSINHNPHYRIHDNGALHMERGATIA